MKKSATGLLGAMFLSVLAPLAMTGIAHANDRYVLGTVDTKPCKNGINFGARASGRYMIACLIKTSALLDLDAPDAAQHIATAYGYGIHPDLLAKWQANPSLALGKKDGFVPVRMDDAIVDYVPSTISMDLFTVYTLSGKLISSNGSMEKAQDVVIVMGMVKGVFKLNDVTYPSAPTP